MTTPNEELRARLDDHLRNQRFRTHEEVRYWLDQYRQLAVDAIAALARLEEGREAVAWLLPEYGRAFVKQENLHDFLMERVPSYRVTAAASKAIPLYPPNEMSGNPCHHCGADPGEPCYPNDVCHPAPHSGGDGDAEVARLRQALQDVADPIGYLRREAEAKGERLGGMAYSIANDLHFVQQIASRALATPTPQSGEGADPVFYRNPRQLHSIVPAPASQQSVIADGMDGSPDWRIDTSAGGPILVYRDCSVIEGEQAEYVLSLINADHALPFDSRHPSDPEWGIGNEESRMDAIITAFNTWPSDLRKKLSLHDLRRMAGWAPTAPASPQGVSDAWREAIIDECTIACIDWDEADPRSSLARLIAWREEIALDPAVSDRAAALALHSAEGVDAETVVFQVLQRRFGSLAAVTRDDAKAVLAALTAKPATAGQQAAGVSEDISRIGELIRTQDNRITSEPIFVVEELWPGSKSKYRFATACFTEQGCKDYMARNGHNLNKPRIYAYSGFRNAEWISLRNFLASATAAGAAPEGLAGELVEMGDDDEGQPRLVIHTTREAIKASNLCMFRSVGVRMLAAAQQPGAQEQSA